MKVSNKSKSIMGKYCKFLKIFYMLCFLFLTFVCYAQNRIDVSFVINEYKKVKDLNIILYVVKNEEICILEKERNGCFVIKNEDVIYRDNNDGYDSFSAKNDSILILLLKEGVYIYELPISKSSFDFKKTNKHPANISISRRKESCYKKKYYLCDFYNKMISHEYKCCIYLYGYGLSSCYCITRYKYKKCKYFKGATKK